MSKVIQTLLLLGLFAVLLTPAASSVQDIRPRPTNPNNIQTELRHVGLLMLGGGKVEEIGFMKFPLKVFNEGSLLPDQTPRYKKWDNFDVFGDNFYLTLSLADLGSTGAVRVTFYDFQNGERKVITRNLPKESLPNLSYTTYRYTNGTADDISFETEDLSFKIENVPVAFGSRFYSRRIQITSNDLNVDFRYNVSSDHESLATITPLDNTHQRFLYEVSSGNVPTEGTIKLGDNEKTFDDLTSAGGHYFSRGILNDQTYMVKARGQGTLENGKRFSLLLGSGYGDTEAAVATADGFILDRFLSKLNAVGVELDEEDLLAPIKFKTLFNQKKNFKECRVVFTPSHVEKSQVGDEQASIEAAQIVGTFSGYVTDYKNKKHSFTNLQGVVELSKIRVTGEESA